MLHQCVLQPDIVLGSSAMVRSAYGGQNIFIAVPSRAKLQMLAEEGVRTVCMHVLKLKM